MGRARAHTPPHVRESQGRGGPQRGPGKGPQGAQRIVGGMGPGPGPAHAKKVSIARAQEGINSKGNIVGI